MTKLTAGKADQTVVDATELPTNGLGRSTFAFEVEEAGDYRVIADRRSNPPDTREFTIRVVPAIDWTYTLNDNTTHQTQTNAPLRFIRGRHYTLEIDLPPEVNLADARAMLVWSGDYSAKGLGMTFTPATGAYVVIGNKTRLSWAIDCNDLRNGDFDLTFFCNRLEQRLVLAGRLDAPPPVVLSPANNATVDLWPLLRGLGTPSAQIYLFEGREKDAPVLGYTSVSDDGTWVLRPSKPLSTGPHVLSVKQRHVDTTEAWAADVGVIAKDLPLVVQAPVKGGNLELRAWFAGTGNSRAQIFVFEEPEKTLLGSTTVSDDGTWFFRVDEPLQAGALVVSFKQQYEDSTESWVRDFDAVVTANNYVCSPVLLSPVSGATVQTQSWAEGITTPGYETKIIKAGNRNIVYAQGFAAENGRWRMQFQPNLPVGNEQTLSVGTYIAGAEVWLLPNPVISVVAATTVSSPVNNATVQEQPWLIGTGSPRAHISVFDGAQGPLLGRSVADDDGKWRLFVLKPMTAGAHQLSVRQRREDGTEIVPLDITVTVNTGFVAAATILTFASGDTVEAGSWVEGLGLPGVEIRIVKGGVPATIYARGIVRSDGRWRIQFLSTLPVAPNTKINAAFYESADSPPASAKSAWLTEFPINVVPAS